MHSDSTCKSTVRYPTMVTYDSVTFLSYKVKREKHSLVAIYQSFQSTWFRSRVMIQNKLGCTQLNWWVNKYLTTFHKYWQPVIQRNVKRSLRENYIRFLMNKKILHRRLTVERIHSVTPLSRDAVIQINRK